jgi:hypothetical protein
MCATSFILEDWTKKLPDRFPWVMPHISQLSPAPPAQPIIHLSGPSQKDFDALVREVAALKDLLQATKRYDFRTKQPECEQGDKVELLRKVAGTLGISIEDVFPTAPPNQSTAL